MSRSPLRPLKRQRRNDDGLPIASRIIKTIDEASEGRKRLKHEIKSALKDTDFNKLLGILQLDPFKIIDDKYAHKLKRKLEGEFNIKEKRVLKTLINEGNKAYRDLLLGDITEEERAYILQGIINDEDIEEEDLPITVEDLPSLRGNGRRDRLGIMRY